MQDLLPIRLIVLDIDGTLFNSARVIPEENIRAIQEAQKKGVTVAIATGRFAENAYLILQKHGLSCPILGMNASKIIDKNRNVLAMHPMAPEAVQAVHSLLCQVNTNYFIYTEHGLCSGHEDYPHYMEANAEEVKKMEALGYHFKRGRETADAFCHQPVLKFYVSNTVPLDEIEPRLAAIPGVSITRFRDKLIDVMAKGVDKGFGVRVLAEKMHLSLNEVMCIGDDANDLSMLKTAGWSVAMGNAFDEVKAVARFHTDTNDQCGVAKAIEKYVLS